MQMSLSEVRRELSVEPGQVLEEVANRHGLPLLEVTRCLPEGAVRTVPGRCFGEILQAVTAWGQIVMVVHSEDLVLEYRGEMPAGQFGRGFYNLEGHKGLSGHLRHANCVEIAFVVRCFMERPTASIQFFNAKGQCMFKVFLRRGEDGLLDADQLQAFNRLADRLAD